MRRHLVAPNVHSADKARLLKRLCLGLSFSIGLCICHFSVYDQIQPTLVFLKILYNVGIGYTMSTMVVESLHLPSWVYGYFLI